MNRIALTFGLAIALAAWADAQNAPPTASDFVKQYRLNQSLLVNLVDHTVELANAGAPLAKAEACHRVMIDLAYAMELAVTNQDTHRVAELGDHVIAVVNDALVPSLESAGKEITDKSPNYATLKTLHVQAHGDLEKLNSSVPVMGTLGTSATVKATLRQMQAAAAALKTALK